MSEDPPKLQENIKFHPHKNTFITYNSQWRVGGPAKDIPEGEVAIVSLKDGTEREVYIVKHLATRRVYHRRRDELVDYVIAEFENIVDEDEI